FAADRTAYGPGRVNRRGMLDGNGRVAVGAKLARAVSKRNRYGIRRARAGARRGKGGTGSHLSVQGHGPLHRRADRRAGNDKQGGGARYASAGRDRRQSE